MPEKKQKERKTPTNLSFPAGVRWAVLEPFNGTGRHCAICGGYIYNQEECIEHIVPRSQGGADEPANLRVVHLRCRQWTEKDAIRPRRPNLPGAVTRAVLEEFERGGRLCFICAEMVSPTAKIAIDHIVPRSQGGTDDLDNLQVVHQECNSMKGRKSLDEAQEIMREREDWDSRL